MLAAVPALGAVSCIGPAGAREVFSRPAYQNVPEKQGVELAHFGPKRAAQGRDGLVVSGHPEASRVAVEVLQEGGNACDALLAAAISQTVLQPHLTTLTGCFSMMYYDAASSKTKYLNANVNAPREPLGQMTEADVTTGRAVAVPGYWAGFEAAHREFASMPLAQLMRPAISYARDGVVCEPFLWAEIFSAQSTLGRSETGREIFMPNRAIPNPGERIYQHQAADLLHRLAEEGSGYFYQGGFAEEFCENVVAAGGIVTPEDFAQYEVRWDAPVRGTYGDIDIVAAAAPDVGGVHLVEMFNMIELMDIKAHGPASESPETLKRMMLAAREVLVNGASYNDPRFVPLPLDKILSKDYAAERYAKILSSESVQCPSPPPPPPGSCHLTVVDKAGNIATALHSTLSLPWVNGLFVEGVSICGAGNHFLRTMPPPGARVSVMICPNILFRKGAPLVASGSPSTSLISNLVQNLTNIVDFGMTVEESVRRPTFGGLSDETGRLSIEVDMGEKLIKAATGAGLLVERLNPWNFRHGAFEGILFKDKVAFGCGDPRRTSSALAV